MLIYFTKRSVHWGHVHVHVCSTAAVPCMLEYEGLPGMTSSKPVGRGKRDTKGKADAPKLTVKNLVHTLDDIVGALEHAHVDHSLTVQFLKQVLVCTCTCMWRVCIGVNAWNIHANIQGCFSIKEN